MDVTHVPLTPAHQRAVEILSALFAYCESRKASDIHLAVREVPRARIQGVLAPIPDMAPVTADDCARIGEQLARNALAPTVTDPEREIRERLFRHGSIDGAANSPAGCRYRYNIFRENGETAVALRRLDDRFLSLSELGLPETLGTFCDYPDGLVIVTGPTGSGKSTTLATLIDTLNRTRKGHIITIEDPVEYVHRSEGCLVHQRQIGRDATSFSQAIVDSLRQDPDIILIGEIRDLDSIRIAITAAETGHLVFTTLHAGDCVGAIERLVSVFPDGEQDGIRNQLALVLRGIFAQHLLSPAVEGNRRVACGELLVVTTAISNLIATGRSQQIYSSMETGRNLGMRTLDQELARLVTGGRITERTALSISKNPQLLKNWMRLKEGELAS